MIIIVYILIKEELLLLAYLHTVACKEKGVIVGLLLGDAWLEKKKGKRTNARFRFEQSHIRTPFFFLCI